LPNAKRYGFRKEVEKLLDEKLEIKIIPDLYRICEFGKTLFVYEIEDSNSMSIDKLQLYADLWDMFDNDDLWHMMLICLNRYGIHQTIIDLNSAFYYFLEKDAYTMNLLNENQ
jgi:hypothetical protein